jgi:hypothetical protein
MGYGILQTHRLLVITLLVLSAGFVTKAQTPNQVPDQVIDIPSLVGRSPDEVDQILGKKPSRKYSGPRLPNFDEWRLYKVGRHLSVYFRQKRAVAFNFLLKQNQYTPTPEGALLAVGIDVNGTPPSQSYQNPWPTPGDVVFAGKDHQFFWSGIFGGIEWGAIQVRGNENRFNGSGFSKDYWKVKTKYFFVSAFATDLDVKGQ